MVKLTEATDDSLEEKVRELQNGNASLEIALNVQINPVKRLPTVTLEGLGAPIDGQYEARSFMKEPSGHEIRRYKDGWVVSRIGKSDDQCWAFLESTDLVGPVKWLSNNRKEIRIDVTVN